MNKFKYDFFGLIKPDAPAGWRWIKRGDQGLYHDVRWYANRPDDFSLIQAIHFVSGNNYQNNYPQFNGQNWWGYIRKIS
jgi:hypothetical protein